MSAHSTRVKGITGGLRRDGNRIRLDTLVRLRWLAVAGQTAAIVIVHFWLQFPLPLGWCFALVALSAWLNLFLKIRYPSSRRLDEWAAGALLAYDVAQLSGLLYLTGGLQNPFAFLLLAPVTVSATILPPRRTVLLAALVIGASTLLGVFHLPLPWKPGETLNLPWFYLAGMWSSLVLSLVFISIYAFRVAKEARQLSDALAATELVLAREQHLSSLDGLAAAAAHELGTPLGTIAVVSKELERELPDGSPLAEDAKLLRSQSQRCREILGKLRDLSRDPNQHFGRQRLEHLIEDAISPHRGGPLAVRASLKGDESRHPAANRSPGIVYGLGNFIENAVDFAHSKVDVRARWSDDEVTIRIDDDGPGFSSAIVDRIGEPYVTTRASGHGAQTGGGLGLGVFIAKTLLERSGAQVELKNLPAPGGGAAVAITWSRAAFESATAPAPVPGGTDIVSQFE